MLRQLKSLVVEGCEMAEQMLTPQSRCHCMLPLVTMEHSAALPEQASLWRTILQVRPPTSALMLSYDSALADTNLSATGLSVLKL